VNWDEFAAFARAADSIRTGELRGGGRPGLGTLALLPFVSGCQDEIRSVRAARYWWSGVTLASVVVLFLLVAEMAGRDRRHAWGPWLAIGLWVTVPVFLRWSLQVRTDQPAILFGLVGAWSLVRSRRHVGSAATAGLCFAVGFLFSQKLVYVGALAIVLAAGDLWISEEFKWRREFGRAFLTAVAGLTTLAAYQWIVTRYFHPATPTSFESGFDVFAFYRRVLGFRVYRGMAPSLWPHGVCVALLALGTWALGRAASPTRKRIAIAWAVLVIGCAVAVFHAAAFPYFWMVLGLFPAVAIGLAIESLGDIGDTRVLGATMAVVGTLMYLQGAASATTLLSDSQAVQRESLRFIHRNFPRGAVGFHPERAPFCMGETDPFPTFFSQHITARFGGPDRRKQEESMVQEFVSRPVVYLLDSYRLGQFPARLGIFWRENYLPYFESVSVPGRKLVAEDGRGGLFDLAVSGRYRFISEVADSKSTPVATIDGVATLPLEVIELAAGTHRFELGPGVRQAVLVWALSEPPAGGHRPFYQGGALDEFNYGHLQPR